MLPLSADKPSQVHARAPHEGLDDEVCVDVPGVGGRDGHAEHGAQPCHHRIHQYSIVHEWERAVDAGAQAVLEIRRFEASWFT